MKIEPAKRCITRRDKTNEIINALNPLLNLDVQTDDYIASPIVNYSDNNVTIIIPNGLPSGYEEEVLDVVDSSNTASQRYFLTKSV